MEMQGLTFTSTHIYIDVLYGCTIGAWLCALWALLKTPGLMVIIKQSYIHSHTGRIRLFVERFISWGAFCGLVRFSIVLSLYALSLSLGERLGLLQETMTLREAALWGGMVLACYAVFGVLRYLSYVLWRYIFFPGETGESLVQDHLIISILRMLSLLLLVLGSLSALPTLLVLGVAAGVMLLLQIGQIVQSVRRLRSTPDAGIYVFLYLCTHEILPWLIVLGLLSHLGGAG